MRRGSRDSGASWFGVLIAHRRLNFLPMAADSSDIRPDGHRLVDALQVTASGDDLAHEVCVRQSLEAGLADAESGRTMSAEEAPARVRARIRRAS